MNGKSRKNVLYYSPSIWGNTDFYRTTGVLPFINHPELQLRDVSHFGTISQYDLIGSDIIIIQRPCTPDNLQLIKLAKNCSLKVILDYDDDVLNVDMFNPTFIQYKVQREIILECIELADEVWCSTIGVKQSFGKGIIIPNSLNVKLLGQCIEHNTDSNVVVWRGGSSHEADIYENADEIVDLVERYPEINFYFIGHRFTYLEQRCGDNFNSVEGMPITQYFQYLKQLKPKAMIFPLRDTPLNRSKSNISWIEATWSGAEYFVNKDLPEFSLDCMGSLKGMTGSDHSSSKKYIEENLTLDKINQLRINSILNI